MSTLPDAATLAKLVSNVTDAMCGTRFQPADDMTRGASLCGHMVMLPIKGPRDIRVVLSSDKASSEALTAAMFGLPREDLTEDLVSDAVAELLNQVAGQITSAMRLDQSLGLPKPTTLAELTEGAEIDVNDSVVLSSEGLGQLRLWIFERTPRTAEEAAPQTVSASNGSIRSLIRKVVGGG